MCFVLVSDGLEKCLSFSAKCKNYFYTLNLQPEPKSSNILRVLLTFKYDHHESLHSAGVLFMI